MGFFSGIKYWFFERHRFCCCLPVRAGVIIMSFLNLVVSALLSIIVWYEVASTPTLDGTERGSFIGIGIVETLLALVSVLGFVGAVVRKQSFVTVYCYALYVHFVINLAVAGYFLYVILHAEQADAVKACKDAIQNTGTQDQCLGLLHIAAGLFGGLAGFLLLLELYGALMATRYVHQVKTEKRKARLPLNLRRSTDGSGLMSGYVRYTDANGEAWYDPVAPKDHERPESMYSYAAPYHAAEVGTAFSPSHRAGVPSEEYGRERWAYAGGEDEEKGVGSRGMDVEV
ncbi:hypothetical protein EW146_g5014, partial [Bondarzewia mesenterica]